jgi:hypothetical protein
MGWFADPCTALIPNPFSQIWEKGGQKALPDFPPAQIWERDFFWSVQLEVTLADFAKGCLGRGQLSRGPLMRALRP